MKKFYLLSAGFILLLGSCSQDDVVSMNRDSDEIRFAAVTNGPTRAADIYSPTAMPASFNVSAMSQGQVYITNDVIKQQGTSWVNSTGTRYWPESTVDFYAHVNAGAAFELNNGAPKFTNFVVNGTVGSQVDLLYAVKKGASKTETPVTLNFRHALSQIVFKAKNVSENIFVQIKGIKVVNVKCKGTTYKFPTSSTDPNIPTSGSSDQNTRGEWTLDNSKTAYTLDFDLTDVKGSNPDGTVVNLTDTKDMALMLLPQETDAWVPTTTPKPGDETENTYLLVNCVIYNVKGSETGDEVNVKDEVCLCGQGSDEAGWGPKELAIPVKFDWDEGKKYTYTLVFGNGNGGYDPDPDPGPDPDPVLVPITFTVTVDEFLNGGDYDVESPDEPGQTGN